MSGLLVPIIAMFIPIVAIAGGITVAIFRTLGQQKVAELAMRERIAALEKGIDPATLPPLPTVADPAEVTPSSASARERALRTAQGLQIGGLVTLFVGLGLALMLVILDTGVRNLWAVGLVPAFVGLALLLAGQLVRRDAPSERLAPGAPLPAGPLGR